jgi:hypothetical protein
MTYCTREDSSSSSDSDDEILSVNKSKKWGHVRDLYEEKTYGACSCLNFVIDGFSSISFPHVGQNLWFHFDSISDIDGLIKNLHPLGIREAALKKQLQKHRDHIAQGLTAGGYVSQRACISNCL